MDLIYEIEDQTYTLAAEKQQKVADNVVSKYNNLYDARRTQIDEANSIRNEIYLKKSYTENKETEYKDFIIPELYELAQSFEAHLYENIYKIPESMFDCQGEDEKSQAMAATQKAMLVNAFEKMKFQKELSTVSECLTHSGEAVMYISWEKRVKRVRRKKTVIEKLKEAITNGFTALLNDPNEAAVNYENLKNSKKNYVEYDKLVYEGAMVECLDNLEFVFDPFKSKDLENADMIYRKHLSYDDILSNKNYKLSPEAKDTLSKIDEDNATKDRESDQIKSDGDKEKGKDGLIEILEFWGNVKVDKKTLRNYLIVVANKKHIIRFEPNPYVHKPFVYFNIIEDNETKRGISPLRVAQSLNKISSEILSKQVYAYDLSVNAPWLSTEKMFDKDILVKPGKNIRYKSDPLNPGAKPERLDFSKAFIGWDFIQYFKGIIENATGIFKNMVGQVEGNRKTATETQAIVAGQSARQNKIADKVFSYGIVPTIEKVADTIANEKFGDEELYQYDRSDSNGKNIKITDETRNGNYRYIYSDRKAAGERAIRFKEVLATIKEFMQDPRIGKRIDIVELFKMALEYLGFDNTGRIIYDDQEQVESEITEIDKNKAVQDYAQATALGYTGSNDPNGQMAIPQGVPQEQAA